MTDAGLELTFTGRSPHSFAHPEQLFAAYTQKDAWAILGQVETLRARGFAIAGFLSYELGYSCVELPEPAHHTRSPDVPYLVLGAFSNVTTPPQHTDAQDPFIASKLHPRISSAAYRAAFSEIVAGLYLGNFYQINLSVPFDFTYRGDPSAGFTKLLQATNAPYAAFLRYYDTALLSLSPELFLRFDGKTITTKPMKGTASLDAIETLQSAKNRAEHVMIVDLLRNDLSIVCERVAVEHLFDVEQYPTFATMTSTISGILAPHTQFADIVRALFPCGSITGAPKRAAMQTIGRLERHARNAYCGSIGYLLPDGRGEWNVAIRTVQLDCSRGVGRLDLGGGIVADSKSDDEWRELEIKGRFFETANFSDHDRV